jgi:hypothetical protein
VNRPVPRRALVLYAISASCAAIGALLWVRGRISTPQGLRFLPGSRWLHIVSLAGVVTGRARGTSWPVPHRGRDSAGRDCAPVLRPAGLRSADITYAGTAANRQGTESERDGASPLQPSDQRHDYRASPP